MILALYQDIGNELAPLEQLNWIDLDKGQLEKTGQFESLLCPAVLINFEDGIDWEELARSRQSGIASVTIKVAVTLPQSTHVKPAPVNQTEQSLNDTLLVEDIVHNKLILTKGVIRTKTRSYYSGTFFVTEHIYDVPYGYEPEPRYHIHSLANKPHIGTELNLPLNNV